MHNNGKDGKKYACTFTAESLWVVQTGVAAGGNTSRSCLVERVIASRPSRARALLR